MQIQHTYPEIFSIKMIEKFDLTQLICMSGNMGPADLEESQRLRWLVNDNPKNLDYHLEQARFFAGCDDNIHTIISYCYIVKNFDNNLEAYIELTEFLYSISYYEWAMIVAIEGLKYHKNEKLQNLLNDSTKGFIDIYQNDVPY